MAQSFPETAIHNSDPKAYAEGWERIFGKKKEQKDTECPTESESKEEESKEKSDT